MCYVHIRHINHLSWREKIAKKKEKQREKKKDPTQQLSISVMMSQ
jgi:hypothetical protein